MVLQFSLPARGGFAMRKIALLLFVLACTLACESALGKEPALKPEELIAKHLASIGTLEAIVAVKSRVAEGNIHFTFQSQAGAQDRKQTFASQDDKLHFYLGLPNPNYRGERFIFDGGKNYVAEITPGVRSGL